MEKPSQTIARLVGALETLTQEEHLLLEHSDFAAAAALREREQPLVSKIAELLVQPGVARSLEIKLQDRVQNLLNAQQAQVQRLAARMAETRESLSHLQVAQTRAQLLRPAYGQTLGQSPALSFAGNA